MESVAKQKLCYRLASVAVRVVLREHDRAHVELGRADAVPAVQALPVLVNPRAPANVDAASVRGAEAEAVVARHVAVANGDPGPVARALHAAGPVVAAAQEQSCTL